MTTKKTSSLFLAAAAMLAFSGSGVTGRVEQGRVIAYDTQTRTATLILESDPSSSASVPLTVKVPEDPDEMGPTPSAGRLISVDTKTRRIVIFDVAAKQFRTELTRR